MREMKHSLFGYNAKEVDESIRALKADLRYLRTENEKQARQIEELNQQLRKAKAEEELIREAVLDAKHLSKRLVREAKEQATEMIFNAEKDINEQFVQFEQSMSALKTMRETIIHQKMELKRELVETIDRYRGIVEEVDHHDQNFSELEQSIANTLEDAEDVISSSKQVIFLPKPLKKQQEAVQAGFVDTKLSDDIPVYSFQ